MSPAPYLDIAFPSVVDPTMAPAGRHVMSVYMQYAPYRLRNGGSWAAHRGRARGHRPAHAGRLRARHVGARRASPGPDAGRLRGDLRPDRRPHLPRRAVARSAVHDAAHARMGPIRVTGDEPVSLRVGHASRHRVDRRLRARTPRAKSSVTSRGPEKEGQSPFYQTCKRGTVPFTIAHMRRILAAVAGCVLLTQSLASAQTTVGELALPVSIADLASAIGLAHADASTLPLDLVRLLYASSRGSEPSEATARTEVARLLHDPRPRRRLASAPSNLEGLA